MALEVILLKTPYSIAFTGNPMPFMFAVSPYGDVEKAQSIILQVRVLVEDSYGTNVFTEVHSQNIYPDNNGVVSIDVHTLLDPYLKWFTPKPTMQTGVLIEAPEQRKQYKLSYLLQQNGDLVGATAETGLFLCLKGGLSYENWKPVDFFSLTEEGQPLHFPVSKNMVLPDQPLFFWWLMTDIPESTCIAVAYTPVNLNDVEVGQEYDDYVYVTGSAPITVSNFAGPAGMIYTFDGAAVHLEGFPTTAGKNQTVSFTLSNCSGVPVVFSQAINVFVAVTIDRSQAMPDATVGDPYSHDLAFTGSDVMLSDFAAPAGLTYTLTMNAQNNGGTVTISGTPTSAGNNVAVFFTLSNSGSEDYYQKTMNVAGTTNCIPVILTPYTLPDAQINIDYDEYVYYSGTEPVNFIGNTSKPSWMTIEQTGGAVHLYGTPDIAATNLAVFFGLDNCAQSAKYVNEHIDVTSNCVPVDIDNTYVLPAAQVNVAYSADIPFVGETDAAYIYAQDVSTWMTVSLVPNNGGTGGVIHLSGTPTQTETRSISITVSNCSGDLDTYSATISVTASTGTGFSISTTETNNDSCITTFRTRIFANAGDLIRINSYVVASGTLESPPSIPTPYDDNNYHAYTGGILFTTDLGNGNGSSTNVTIDVDNQTTGETKTILMIRSNTGAPC